MGQHTGSVVTWIGAVVRAQPHRPAVVHNGSTWTYRQLWERTHVVARSLLAQGLRPGEAVGLMGGNDPAYVALYLGIMRAGGTAVPVNALLDAPAAREQLALVDAERVFVGRVDDGVRAELAESLQVLPMTTPEPGPGTGRLPRVGAGSPSAIMLTSGTTGRPKGVVHTQATMLHAALQLAAALPYSQEDRSLVFLPLYACLPEQVLPVLCTGGSLEILPGFDVDRVADACTRATTFDAVPTVLSRLVEHAPLHKLANLRWVTFASEIMPVPLLERWWVELPGVETHQLYGMTEILPLTVAPHAMLRREPSTVGRPLPTTRMSFDYGTPTGTDESGEVLAASPALMEGYYRDEVATKSAISADGMMRTGDLGRMDERGLVFLTGRSKDVIISGGVNIAPAEIEAVASQHPEVERVMVVGVPSDRWGETPVVVAVPRPGGRLTPGELLSHCRTLLTGYKRPTGAGLVDALPTTGIGKTAKTAVRKMIVDGEIDLVRS